MQHFREWFFIEKLKSLFHFNLPSIFCQKWRVWNYGWGCSYHSCFVSPRRSLKGNFKLLQIGVGWGKQWKIDLWNKVNNWIYQQMLYCNQSTTRAKGSELTPISRWFDAKQQNMLAVSPVWAVTFPLQWLLSNNCPGVTP